MSVTAEQKKALDNPSFVCKAEIFNRSSGRIVAAGARFDYQDGTTSQKGPVEITVDPGQSVYFLGDNNCVRTVTITAAVKFGNQPVQYIYGQRQCRRSEPLPNWSAIQRCRQAASRTCKVRSREEQ